MKFIVKTITRKPPGAVWFADANPAEKSTLQIWGKSQPGLINSRNKRLGVNVVLNVQVFESQAAYDTYAAGLAALPAAQGRTAYSEANGMTITIRKFLLVE